jgi:hypothetical protein
VGYVQVDGNQNDCLIVEAEMSNCAGSTPMYAIEAYILCHGAVEEISCRPDSSTGTIVASVVQSSVQTFQSMTGNAILEDLLEGASNQNVHINSSDADQDDLDGATREAIISFISNGKVTVEFNTHV